MASYYGPSMVAGALSQALSGVPAGLGEGALAGEDIRQKRAAEELRQRYYGLEASQLPLRQRFMEAEIARMQQPHVTTSGGMVIKVLPNGQVVQEPVQLSPQEKVEYERTQSFRQEMAAAKTPQERSAIAQKYADPKEAWRYDPTLRPRYTTNEMDRRAMQHFGVPYEQLDDARAKVIDEEMLGQRHPLLPQQRQAFEDRHKAMDQRLITLLQNPKLTPSQQMALRALQAELGVVKQQLQLSVYNPAFDATALVAKEQEILGKMQAIERSLQPQKQGPPSPAGGARPGATAPGLPQLMDSWGAKFGGGR